MLKEGMQAPDFSLPDADGRVHRLSDYRGRKVILYFYPKDDTPGCTREACDFRDRQREIAAKNAVIVGISADGAASHRTFTAKYNLPFILLSDPAKEAIGAYGALRGGLLSKTFFGIVRSTFIIDEKGTIAKIFPKVDVSVHIQDVLESL
jgi:peroxiredoxin Q/BCP